MMRGHALALALALVATLSLGNAPAPTSVDSATVRAHQSFLASSAMRGRGSATNDEKVAAVYVATRFESYGLRPAPGMTSFIQELAVPPTRYTRKQGVPEDARTVNAIGYLPGTDPAAGVILVSAHLDHVGMANGILHPGANDDASGTTAVLELARILANGGPYRRGILFVCYGAEELGAVGSHHFAQNLPVPVSDLVANLEFEMIGSADPQLKSGLMMTGFERSNFGALLNAQGASLSPDPYPEQNFFERSDNYELALAGVVAHTVSGWPTTPNYHQPSDTNANIDFEFMGGAIAALVGPLRWLADSDVRPSWKPGKKPVAKDGVALVSEGTSERNRVLALLLGLAVLAFLYKFVIAKRGEEQRYSRR